ncbi:MAG: PD-(D/E)XK nuclease family protein, partial [Spirochaetaceae bacterium]|nr:PD-(D/E)XK nuclease family protein [Spirochaetaceae bacterium]
LMPDEASRAGLARAAATIAGLAALADRAPLAAAVSYLWYEAGYRAALLANPAAQAFEEHFELFHSLAVKADAGNQSLAAFVAGLEPLVGSPDKLDDADLPREGARGVRLMTIHKSKGLEFPVVILPQANNAGRDRDGAEPWAWDARAGVTFKLPPPGGDYKRKSNVFFEHASEERNARQRAEARRLLYVALTRAESHIVVTATAPYREETKLPRSFRAFLLPALGLAPGEGSGEPPGGEGPSAGGESDAAAGGAAAPSGRVPVGSLAEDRLRPLAPGIFAGLIPERGDAAYEGLLRESRARAGRAEPGSIPLVVRSVAPKRRAVSAIARDYAESRPAPEAARPLAVAPGLEHPEGLDPAAWGSLVHAVLEARLRGPAATATDPTAPDSTRAKPLSPAAAAALESALPSEKARSEAVARAERLAAVFLDSELGQRARAAAERLVEWPLALAYDSRGARRIAKGTVDLVIVERDRAVVVDYKTDAAVEPGRYDLQVAAYRRAAEGILGLPTEAYLFYLHGCGVALRVDEGSLAPGLGDAPPTAALPRDFSFLPAAEEDARDGRHDEEES